MIDELAAELGIDADRLMWAIERVAAGPMSFEFRRQMRTYPGEHFIVTEPTGFACVLIAGDENLLRYRVSKRREEPTLLEVEMPNGTDGRPFRIKAARG